MLALFVPYMWSMSVVIDRLMHGLPTLSFGGRRIAPQTALNALVSVVITVDAVVIATSRIAQHYGCT